MGSHLRNSSKRPLLCGSSLSLAFQRLVLSRSLGPRVTSKYLNYSVPELCSEAADDGKKSDVIRTNTGFSCHLLQCINPNESLSVVFLSLAFSPLSPSRAKFHSIKKTLVAEMSMGST